MQNICLSYHTRARQSRSQFKRFPPRGSWWWCRTTVNELPVRLYDFVFVPLRKPDRCIILFPFPAINKLNYSCDLQRENNVSPHQSPWGLSVWGTCGRSVRGASEDHQLFDKENNMFNLIKLNHDFYTIVCSYLWTPGGHGQSWGDHLLRCGEA